MNICITNWSTPWSIYFGGGHAVACNLAKQWSKMGHNVVMVYPTDRKGEYPDDLEYRIVEAVDTARYAWGERSLNIFPMWKTVRKLVSQTPIDIVVGNLDELALLYFVTKKNRQPILTMIAHHPYEVRWDLPAPVRLLIERRLYLLWYAYKHATKIFSVSNFTKNWLITNLMIPAEKIEVVYDGIASKFFDIPRINTGAEITITTWGRFDSSKGADILLNALPTVLENLPATRRIHVNIAGQEPKHHFWHPSYSEECGRLVEDLGIGDKVSFLGWISDAQLRGLLSRTSLCVFPTRGEGFGLMIGEAMAAGIPTISTDVGPVPEIITDGETGLLAPPENPEALAEKILYAINNPSEMEAIAQAGRKRIKKNFTWEKIAERYCLAFESLLNSG